MLALQMTESYFLSCLFMGNMSPYYFKTIFRLCVKCILSFIKIGGAVSEKNDHIRQTFVVLYIGLDFVSFVWINLERIQLKNEGNIEQ